jgi:hypothetical protein
MVLLWVQVDLRGEGVVNRRWWDGRASLIKELLSWTKYHLHVEFEVGMSVWKGIEALRIVVVEALSVVEMYISQSRHTRKSRVQRVWAL